MQTHCNTDQIIFKSSAGIEYGTRLRWINKLWLVRLPNRQTCFVMPCQLLTPEQAGVLEAMRAAAPGAGYEWVSSCDGNSWGG